MSDLYPTLITPASYAFAIWGLIYFSVAVFVVWGLVPSVRDNDLLFHKIGWWFLAGNTFNVLWIITFSQGEPVAWIWVSALHGCW